MQWVYSRYLTEHDTLTVHKNCPRNHDVVLHWPGVQPEQLTELSSGWVSLRASPPDTSESRSSG